MKYLLSKNLKGVGDPFEADQGSNHQTGNNCHQTPRPSDTQTFRPLDIQDISSSFFSPYIEHINKYIPDEMHKNNRCLFGVAQVMRSIERDLGRKMSKDEIKQLFDYWASLSNKFFRPELTYEDYFAELWRIFDVTKFCHDESPLEIAYRNSLEAGYPPGHEQLNSEAFKSLASFCYQLSRLTGGQFFLKAEDAARYFPIKRRQMANRLHHLAREEIGILRLIEKGCPKKKKASVYMYIGDKKQKT